MTYNPSGMTSSNSLHNFMRQAIALALQNVRSGAGGPFAALVVKDGKVIAQGTNRVTAANDPTAHAEIVAIREACRALQNFQLDACHLYTTCEPCPMCFGAIYWARLSGLFFAGTAADAAAAGFEDQFIYKELTRPLSQRQIPTTQILHQESQVIFEAWARQPDKKLY
jgi:guanine deaminase